MSNSQRMGYIYFKNDEVTTGVSFVAEKIICVLGLVLDYGEEQIELCSLRVTFYYRNYTLIILLF